MGKTRKKGIVTYPAWIDTNLVDIFDVQIEGMLAAIGEIAVGIIKGNMTHNDDTGETRKSVMWRTFNQVGKNNTAKVLDRPPNQNTVYAGSAEPSAFYIEYGTMAHISNQDWEKFVAAIKAWAARRGIDPEDVYPIIRYIRNNGTEAKPFMQQSRSDLENFLKPLGNECIVRFLQAIGYKQMHGTPWAHRGPV
jgi:hypothetical protein